MKEIERKFLVNSRIGNVLEKSEHKVIRQGYISKENDATVRVRTKGMRGFLTVKGKPSGITRSEFEYEIPYDDAVEMMDEFCTAIITKKRYLVQHDHLIWEVDVFSGKLDGLIIAEIELQQENEEIQLPEWADREVTHDHSYSNSELAKKLEEDSFS